MDFEQIIFIHLSRLSHHVLDSFIVILRLSINLVLIVSPSIVFIVKFPGYKSLTHAKKLASVRMTHLTMRKVGDIKCRDR